MKVVVIGAGIAGLSIGWRLAKSGCEVVVLERAQPGRGATWASGGMIAAAAEYPGAAGPEAQLADHAASLWPAFAAEIEADSGRKIAYRRDGTLIVALSPDALQRLSARAEASLLDAGEARALEPLLRRDIAGALWTPNDAHIDNRAIGIALAHAFVNAGGILQINEAAIRLEIVQGKAEGVHTPFTLYRGDKFVIAAGAWSGEIAGIPPEAAPPIIPVKGEIIALKPPDKEALPKRLVWGNEIYLIPRRDLLLVGATTSREGFNTTSTRAARDWLFTHAVSLMPALEHWNVVDQWAGLRPGSPDDLPLIGETAVHDLFVASGQYRNGILFAPAIADALCSLIADRGVTQNLQAFDPKRFDGSALAKMRQVR